MEVLTVCFCVEFDVSVSVGLGVLVNVGLELTCECEGGKYESGHCKTVREIEYHNLNTLESYLSSMWTDLEPI